VVVSVVAVACLKPLYLLIGSVQDHVLSQAVSGVMTLPEGENRLSLVVLDLEVHGVLLLVLERIKPHGFTSIIEDQWSVLGRTLFAGTVLWSDEDVAWGCGGVVVRGGEDIYGGRVEIRPRAEAAHVPRPHG
jgi:hypothetical protein